MNTQKNMLGATSTDMIFNGRQGLNNTSDSAPENMTQPTDVSEKSQHKVVHNQHFLFHTPDSYQTPLGHTSSDKCQQLPEANTEADNSTPTQRQFVPLNHPLRNTHLVKPQSLMRASHVH